MRRSSWEPGMFCNIYMTKSVVSEEETTALVEEGWTLIGRRLGRFHLEKYA